MQGCLEERARTPAPRTAAPAVAAATRAGVRPEIQALRATAVLLVVVFHLWPSVLPGGFVGVDVFFAISGFLISSLLVREIERTGSLSLAGFWARRARRILPAALLVLFACALATAVFVPQTYWPQFMAEIRASTVYVQNWHLASAAVDYMAASDGPSPVQHYWSLSAEEQFYLVWPVALIVAVAVSRGRGRRALRLAIGATMGALTVASLAYSLYATAAAPAAAYFVTPTRAWEFGLGGLLALAPAPDGRHPAVRSVLSWAGIAAILVAAVTFNAATPFPGWTALLPVLGAVAVMRAGSPAPRWSPSRLLGLRPLQFVGDVSYSIYLWHWPLLVLAPFVIGRATDTRTEVAIVMLTILAAWLSKRFVEDPIRAGRFLVARRPGWTFAAAAAATLAVLVVPTTGTSYVDAQVAKAHLVSRQLLASHPTCFGAAARDPLHPCSNPRLRLTVVPSPAEARDAENSPCAVVERRGRVRACAFGERGSAARGTVALIGDSHASHWRAALAIVAHVKHWRGLSVTHTSCPYSSASAVLVEPDASRCAQWKRDVNTWLARHPEIGTIFVVGHTGSTVVTRPGQSLFDAQVAGYTGAWRRLPASVRRIVVIRDTPRVRSSTLACVAQAVAARRTPGTVCAVPRRGSLDVDPQTVAARRWRGPQRAAVLDLTPFFCGRGQCYPVIGGALVYHDISHLTQVFARSLGPYVLRGYDAATA